MLHSLYLSCGHGRIARHRTHTRQNVLRNKSRTRRRVIVISLWIRHSSSSSPPMNAVTYRPHSPTALRRHPPGQSFHVKRCRAGITSARHPEQHAHFLTSETEGQPISKLWGPTAGDWVSTEVHLPATSNAAQRRAHHPLLAKTGKVCLCDQPPHRRSPDGATCSIWLMTALPGISHRILCSLRQALECGRRVGRSDGILASAAQ